MAAMQAGAAQAIQAQGAPEDQEDDLAAEAMAEEEAAASDDLAGLWQPLEAPPGLEPFDVARFFESLSAEYGWLPSQIMEQPWKTLLSYAREADLRKQREQKAIEDAQRTNKAGQEVVPAGMEEAHLRQYLPGAPIPWEVDDSPVG